MFSNIFIANKMAAFPSSLVKTRIRKCENWLFLPPHHSTVFFFLSSTLSWSWDFFCVPAIIFSASSIHVDVFASLIFLSPPPFTVPISHLFFFISDELFPSFSYCSPYVTLEFLLFLFTVIAVYKLLCCCCFSNFPLPVFSHHVTCLSFFIGLLSWQGKKFDLLLSLFVPVWNVMIRKWILMVQIYTLSLITVHSSRSTGKMWQPWNSSSHRSPSLPLSFCVCFHIPWVYLHPLIFPWIFPCLPLLHAVAKLDRLFTPIYLHTEGSSYAVQLNWLVGTSWKTCQGNKNPALRADVDLSSTHPEHCWGRGPTCNMMFQRRVLLFTASTCWSLTSSKILHFTWLGSPAPISKLVVIGFFLWLFL